MVARWQHYKRLRAMKEKMTAFHRQIQKKRDNWCKRNAAHVYTEAMSTFKVCLYTCTGQQKHCFTAMVWRHPTWESYISSVSSASLENKLCRNLRMGMFYVYIHGNATCDILGRSYKRSVHRGTQNSSHARRPMTPNTRDVAIHNMSFTHFWFTYCK